MSAGVALATMKVCRIALVEGASGRVAEFNMAASAFIAMIVCATAVPAKHVAIAIVTAVHSLPAPRRLIPDSRNVLVTMTAKTRAGFVGLRY